VVEITTTGGGCERKGTTEVVVNQGTRTAEISPRDYTDTAAEVCTLQLKMFVHDVMVTFATPGTATVEIHARSDYPTVAPVVFRRTIQITE
jgi:hypothetical protein